MKISALIPAFNESMKIESIVQESSRYVDDVIVCDDGSADNTGEIAEKSGARVIKHNFNRGYGAAIQSLFREALDSDADIFVTLDSDGQHKPQDISNLVTHLIQSECDIAIGSRFIGDEKQEIPDWRAQGIKTINRLVNTSGAGITDSQSGFRAYTRKALEVLTLTDNGMGVSTEILVKAMEHNLKICEVPVEILYPDGSSKQNPLLHGVSVVLSTVKYLSINRPLLFYGLPGGVSLLVSLYFWGWTFKIYSLTRSINTNITLIAIVTTLVGLILLNTSIILWVVGSQIREYSRAN